MPGENIDLDLFLSWHGKTGDAFCLAAMGWAWVSFRLDGTRLQGGEIPPM